MKRVTAIILISVTLIVPVLAHQPARKNPAVKPKVRFAPVHIYIDSGSKALAAYQFELKAGAGQIKIVGVEGGRHAAFKEAPYYDPAALSNNRIIIAAFNTTSELPKGRTRIATVHLQIIGEAEPDYELKLDVAADADGEEIQAKINLEKEIENDN
jgi:hypothetical protein